MQYKCHPGQFCVYSWFNAQCLLKDCYIRAQRTWVIQHINQWERYWISSADEIQLQSFYYTGRQRFKGCQTDIHTLLSMVSRKRVRSSMAASQFCMRISDASFPQRELRAFLSVEGTWSWRRHSVSVNFSVIFHSKISLVQKSHSHCYKFSAITLL